MDARHLFDSELEAFVLGTILAAGEPAYRQVESIIDPDDFGTEKHKLIFRTIARIASEIDPSLTAVTHALMESGQIEKVDGMAGLVDIHARAIPGIGLGQFAQTLRDKSVSRRALGLSGKLSRELELHGLNGNAAAISATAQELIALAENKHPPVGGLAIEDLPDVGATDERIEFLREPELPEGSVVALTGDSGSGKSTLASAWARDAIRAGRPCLILDRENPRSVVRERMQRLGLEDGRSLRWWGGWLGDEAPRPDSAIVLDWVRSCARPPIVVVDSLAAFHGGDENSAGEMRAFMDGPRRLANLGACVTIIHHDGKADSSKDYRGSSDFKASIDQAFHVTNISVSGDGKLDRLRLRCFKSRLGLTGDLVYHYAGGRMVRDEGPEAQVITVAEQLTGLLRQNPGIKGKAFEDLAHTKSLGRNRSRNFLENGLLSEVIRRKSGDRGAFHYYLAGGSDDE